MKTPIWAFALVALTAFGGDVTGKWAGSMELTRNGETHSDTAYMILKQDGANVTGSVGPNAERQFTIKTGRIEDDHITLEVVPDEGPSLVKFNLKLTADDRLTGEMQAEGGEGKMSAKFELKREK